MIKPKRIDFANLVRFYKTFGRHYKRHTKTLALAFASLLATIFVTLLAPWPLKLIIDHIILDSPLPAGLMFLAPWFEDRKSATVAVLAISIVLIEVLMALFSYFNKFYVSSVGHRMVGDIRERVFAHLQRLSLSFHDTSQTGDIIYRMTSDVKDLKSLLIDTPQDLGSRLLTIISITTVMLILNWQLALIAFAVVPFLYLFMHRFGTAVNKAVKKLKKEESKIASTISENFKAMPLIQAYGQEAAEQAEFEERTLASLEHELRSINLAKGFKWVMDTLAAIGTAAVVFFGARRVLGVIIPPGTLILFIAYLKDLYGPIDKLSEAVLAIAKTQVSGLRIMELVENEMVIHDDPAATVAPEFEGQVTFQNVTFAYNQGGDVLKDLSFSVAPGQTVALVGHSGAGKSTLISLLLRFYDPNQGQILFDGTDIRRYQLKSLRSRITILLQEAVLFRKTIRENIAFGKPNASLEEVVEAAKLAQAHDFIIDLPEGYDTLIWEGGGNLSGGQKQRLSIARAIIRNAPILILDEPATGLDAATEAKVNIALEHLTQGKTTFIIAHQLSTIQHADTILLLDDGRLVQQGTHEELLRTNAIYQEFSELQQVA